MVADSGRLKQLLHEKIETRKQQIYPDHNSKYNYNLQLEIDTIEWVLGKIELNKFSDDRLEGIIRVMIKDLEKRKNKAVKIVDTDNYWIRIETLQWVLYVILAIRNGNMVVI